MIEPINLGRLRNHLYAQYFVELRSLAVKFNAEEIGIVKVMEEMKPFIERVQVLLKGEAGSKYTPEIEETDDVLDNAWRGADLIIEGNLLSPFPVQVEAAKSLERLFDKYGDPRKLSFAEEMSRINSLTDEMMSDEYEKDTKTIHIQDWAPKMKKLSSILQDLIEKRRLELSVRDDSSVREERKLLTPLHSKFLKMLEAIFLFGQETSATKAFLDAFNKQIVEYQKKY